MKRLTVSYFLYVLLAVLLLAVQGCFFRSGEVQKESQRATAVARQATYDAAKGQTLTAEAMKPTTTPSPSATPTPRLTVHIVESGDTLSKIAKLYGVTVEALIVANNIENPSRLRTGQEIIIPPKGPIRPTPTRQPLRPTETPIPEQAEAISCIPWQEAIQYVGEKTCIYGRITRVYSDGQAYYLGFSEAPDSFRLTVSLRGVFEDWLGVCILALGIVEFDGERPYTVISDLAQVQSCEHQPMPPIEPTPTPPPSPSGEPTPLLE
jgi:LysM repeat protein